MQHAPNTIQKILVSTTSNFVGEFNVDKILITHAWPSMRDQWGGDRLVEGPTSRSAYVLVFETEELAKDAFVIPQYDGVGDVVCAFLSVLFGKRFDNHGPLQNSGYYGLPDMSPFNILSRPGLPQNAHKPRSDIPIPLDLGEIRRIQPLIVGDKNLNQPDVKAFVAAARFYLNALQSAENAPESAYLFLITAGEILADAFTPSIDDVLDDEIKRLLASIESEMADGKKVANSIKGRLYQVRRKYGRLMTHFTDASFFERREADHVYEAFKQDEFKDAVLAAYDLRSRFVHTGVPFGSWIRPGRRGVAEIQHGKPVVEDPKMKEILGSAPTYVGLERITRYVMLRFAAERLGIDIDIAEGSGVAV